MKLKTILTIEMLKEMKPNSIFASGFFYDSPINHIETARWVAQRGITPNWSIFYRSVEDSIIKGCISEGCVYVNDTPETLPMIHCQHVHDCQEIAKERDMQIPIKGIKLNTKEYIRFLVPCTEEALNMYNFQENNGESRFFVDGFPSHLIIQNSVILDCEKIDKEDLPEKLNNYLATDKVDVNLSEIFYFQNDYGIFKVKFIGC